MQEITLAELESRASQVFEDQMETLSGKLSAKKAIENKLAELRDEGKIQILTEEEERLVFAFRRFKIMMKRDGEVFRFQTCRDPRDIIVVGESEQALVDSPQQIQGE